MGSFGPDTQKKKHFVFQIAKGEIGKGGQGCRDRERKECCVDKTS